MKPERTAIARRMLSRPTWEYVTRGVLRESDRVLDYGCGRGADVQILRLRGIDATGYDPHPAFGFPDPSSETFQVGLDVPDLEELASGCDAVRVGKLTFRTIDASAIQLHRRSA